MQQVTLAAGTFEPYRKATRREILLSEMDRVVPWAELCAMLPEGRRVIRWSCLHDPVTGSLYDAHTGSSLGETLDEATESAELLSFGLSESSQLT
jgi:hypothetical protein